MADKRRVVVTGLGVATPIGLGIEAFWDALTQRRCGIGPVRAFDASGFDARIAGELPAFQLGDYIPKAYRKSAKVMSRDINIAVVCAYHAVKDAGLRTRCLIEREEVAGPPNFEATRFGANIGAGLVCADLAELSSALATSVDADGSFSFKKWGGEGMTNLTPLWLLKFLPNMLACHVTIVHDAQGPSNTITCGEASSHLAIGEAFRTIARGDVDACVCGGAESWVNPIAFARSQLIARQCKSADFEPAEALRPFGADRCGLVASDGGGLVILESLEHARARGARIYAELVGFGAATDVKNWTEPDPQADALSQAMRAALRDAAIDAARVDLAVPAGVGTRAHDAMEIAAWNRVLGDRLPSISAIATRGAIGVCGAGAGAIDFAAMVMAVHRGAVPYSRGTQNADRASRFRFVDADVVDVRAGYALSTGYSLAGGQTAAVVVKKFEG